MPPVALRHVNNLTPIHLSCSSESWCLPSLSPVQVSLLVPGCDRLPAELDSALNSMRSFLLVKNLPLSQLLDKEFLEKAVYKGWPNVNHLTWGIKSNTHSRSVLICCVATEYVSVCTWALLLYALEDDLLLTIFTGSTYGLSYQTRIDEDNCFALLPNGMDAWSVTL